MPLASGTMKDENSLIFLSLSGFSHLYLQSECKQKVQPEGLTRQSRSSFNIQALRLLDSRSRIKYGTSFAGMTVLDWIVYFRENLRLIE
jgi:hypothetical protein